MTIESILPFQKTFTASNAKVDMSEHPLTGYYREEASRAAEAEANARNEELCYYLGKWREKESGKVVEVVDVTPQLIIWRHIPPLSAVWDCVTNKEIWEKVMEKGE